MQRTIVAQQLDVQLLVVGITPTPLSQTIGLQALCDSFMISVPVGAANSIFIGGPGVTAAGGGGMEIVAGGLVNFRINNERYLYEVRNPLIKLVTCMMGFFQPDPTDDVPFVAWDAGNIYTIAIAPTNISVMFFKSAYM